jgi:hypothetical protein
MIMKHAYIDLGLPSGTLWATKNLTIGKQKHFTHYEAILLEKIHKHLELPSREDFKELIKYCTWKWTCLFGKTAGYKVTGPNGNSIFIPALGYYFGATLNCSRTGGYYWSSGFFNSSCTYCLYFSSNIKIVSYNYRYYGRSIRTVKHITKRK